eukprot:6179271-Pleurochrysis_carterae.AAC.6
MRTTLRRLVSTRSGVCTRSCRYVRCKTQINAGSSAGLSCCQGCGHIVPLRRSCARAAQSCGILSTQLRARTRAARFDQASRKRVAAHEQMGRTHSQAQSKQMRNKQAHTEAHGKHGHDEHTRSR